MLGMDIDIIHKVTALIIQDRRLLVVRKGTSATFVSPGGNPAPGENNPEVTLRRALQEELSTTVARVKPFRVFTEKASTGNAQVFLDSYLVRLASPPREGPQVAELAWIASNSAKPLSPIVKEHVLPALKEADLVD